MRIPTSQGSIIRSGKMYGKCFRQHQNVFTVNAKIIIFALPVPYTRAYPILRYQPIPYGSVETLQWILQGTSDSSDRAVNEAPLESARGLQICKREANSMPAEWYLYPKRIANNKCEYEISYPQTSLCTPKVGHPLQINSYVRYALPFCWQID